MDPVNFTSERTGVVVPIPGQLYAFLPHHLPPTIELDREMLRLLTAAERALGGLDAAVSVLPNPDLVLGPLLYGEVSASCRIEGAKAGWDEALQLALEEVDEDNEDHDIVAYLRALQVGLSDLERVPFTVKFMQRMHTLTFQGPRGMHMSPGDFRQVQIFVGVRRNRLTTASYVPPPWQDVNVLMEDLERYACEDHDLPPLLQCAIQHAQFEMIHPFRDGNGKIGRLLMGLFLFYRRTLHYPVLLLSPFFERNRREYYARLRGVSHYGEWEKWLLFFLDGVIRQSQEALDIVRQFVALREQTRARLIADRASGTVLRLVDTLLENPYVTTSYVTQKLGVTVPTARGALAALQNIGFIEEITGRKRGQRFCANGVLDTVLRHD